MPWILEATPRGNDAEDLDSEIVVAILSISCWRVHNVATPVCTSWERSCDPNLEKALESLWDGASRIQIECSEFR